MLNSLFESQLLLPVIILRYTADKSQHHYHYHSVSEDGYFYQWKLSEK